jgi:hypothetical protein
MEIIPKIDKDEAWNEYHDHNPESTREQFNSLWAGHPKSIRIIYGWLLAYEDIFHWLLTKYWFDYDEDIYIYPAFTSGYTKHACRKGHKIYVNIQVDYNHNLDFGIIVHELIHVIEDMSEEATEEATIEMVKDINANFDLALNHG